MFYITISNGLLKNEHRKRMGSSVWEFMWLIDKVTRIDSEGIGHILGGKPINLEDLSKDQGVNVDTISRNLIRLEEMGYIKKIRTPQGIIIKIMKAKKRFNENEKSPQKRIPVYHESLQKRIPVYHESNIRQYNNNITNSNTDNVNNNITNSNTNTKNIAEQSSAKEVNLLINSFKEINPIYNDWFSNKTQRSACLWLISQFGLEQSLKMINSLPEINSMKYAPITVSPYELKQNYSKIKAFIEKQKSFTNTKGFIL